MALIDQETGDYLRKKFADEMTRTVKVEVFRGEANPEAAEFSVNLVTELSQLSDAIRFEVKALDEQAAAEGITASPTLRIGHDLGYRLEYWGAPLGHEAEAFIDTLVLVSSGESGLSAGSGALLELLDSEVRAYSFVTPTCPHCPRSVLQNNRLAIAAPGKVRAIAVEAQENLDLARAYAVSSVPQQLFNEDKESITIGAQPEKAYVAALLRHAGVAPEVIAAKQAELRAQLAQFPAEPDAPLVVGDDNFDDAVAKYPLVVVDCWAEWCGPCRMMAPVIDALAKEMKGQVVFGKLDTEENQETAGRFAVHSIPTLLVFRDGELVDRLVGFKPKPALKKDIEAFLLPA